VTEDFDPHAVPISHAATVMLVDDRPDLHVLMVRRTARMVFASDAWVFPGGRVDPGDHEADLERLCVGLPDADASTILGVPHGGLAWWLAACRETLEEAGLLLLAGDPPPGFNLPALRRRVRDNESLFPDLLLELGLTLDVSAIEEVARFITPLGSPRRFDARFFLARTPDGQEPEHDQGEIVDWEWIRPLDALSRFRSGEMTMISPTVRMVSCLARYATADQALAAARRRLPYKRVRVIDPEGEYRVVLPGEAGYEDARLEVESGWVRLWDPDAVPDTGTSAPARPY
jgi:8-oxo-dGTP pyrophosphatase MutT (NUDIX family)